MKMNGTGTMIPKIRQCWIILVELVALNMSTRVSMEQDVVSCEHNTRLLMIRTPAVVPRCPLFRFVNNSRRKRPYVSCITPNLVLLFFDGLTRSDAGPIIDIQTYIK